jgi:hypothetical protein
MEGTWEPGAGVEEPPGVMGRGTVRIPEVFVHPFRLIPYTDSGGFRTPLGRHRSIRV